MDDGEEDGRWINVRINLGSLPKMQRIYNKEQGFHQTGVDILFPTQ